MATWNDKGYKNPSEFPYSHYIEEEVSPRQIIEMSKWLNADDGLKGTFFFVRVTNAPEHASRMNPPVQFNFTDETTAMHFKLKYG
jgi:hypothetical protein